jgi:hypothetical protein
MKLTKKKTTEMLIAEYFLMHYNNRSKSLYRIDYFDLLKREENIFPDIAAKNMLNTGDCISLEVTRASSHNSKADKNVAAYSKLMWGISKIVSKSKFKTHVSVELNLSNITPRNVKKDLEVFEEYFEKLEIDSYVVENRSMVDTCLVIKEITIKDEKIPSVSLSHWGDIEKLDDYEKVIESYEKKSRLADNDTILLIYLNDRIFDYNFEKLEKYFSKEELKFKEVGIVENVKYGRVIFVNN